MRPSDNAIRTASILWNDARRHNSYDGWRRCYLQIAGIAFFLLDENETDYIYFTELRETALDLMAEAPQ